MKNAYLVLFIGVKVMSDNLLKLYSIEELKRLLLKYSVCAYSADFFRVTHDFRLSGLEYKKGDILFVINHYSDEPKAILINRKMRQHNSFLSVESITDARLRDLLSDRCWYLLPSDRKYFEPLKLHQFLYTGYKGETK